MKYSLHLNLCNPAYLRKADEIIIAYKDRRILPDYVKKYPQARLILEVLPDNQWEIDEIKEYSILSRDKLTLCIPNINDPRVFELIDNNIPFFWGYTVTTFWELEALIASGVSQVRIGAPLMFQCNKLQQYKIEKRVVANVAHEGYLSNVDGITGAWIRPEDVELYEDYIDTIEFSDCKEHKEEALYRIYAEQKHWPGRVDMIITNIVTDAYNRMIAEEFGRSRLNCGQRCKGGGNCRICKRLLYLANPDLIRDYKEKMEEKKEDTLE